MTKILYVPCHSILEYDEVKLLTEMGHEVFSMDSYRNPNSPVDPKRPPIVGYYNDHLDRIVSQCSRENIHKEIIDWADVIIFVHKHEWIIKNWLNIKHKKVVWRSIGQSIPDVEGLLYLPKTEGLKLVRYSPEEKNIPGYIGEDAMIRFYKDEGEFCNWNGQKPIVMTVAQSMRARAKYCGFSLFDSITHGLPRALFGPGNEDSGIEGGMLAYEDLKASYRDARVYFYTGTYPASYTLNFIEAMMTGIPVVAIGPKLADIKIWKGLKTYEIGKIIEHGKNGFCSDNPDELRGNVEYLLAHHDKAKEIGEAGRQTAIELFGKEKIKEEWKDFLENL